MIMPADRPVLGIHTATSRTGLALITGDAVLAEAGFNRPLSPSSALMPMMKTMLEAAGLKLNDLGALAVTVGPGGFTGIRVGLATARTLAEAADLPLAGVSTLAAVAAAVGPVSLPVAPWLDGGRGEVYAGLFRSPAGPGDECVSSPADVLPGLPAEALLFVGDGAVRYGELIAARPHAHPGDQVMPLPEGLAAAAARLGRDALAGGTALPPVPRYLRAPDATRARA
jgi:tRNA threonylcarbamoyladenosine biosynthesis protein TsaB